MFIKGEEIREIIIEKSRFIAYLKRVDSIEEYKDYLSQIKKKHYDATHVCSALILKDTKRSSDDGEPSGTAGVPILNVLEKNNLENCCCLVVRYFGGIKLGAGGLIRAYQKSASEALKYATKVEEVSLAKYKLTLDYEIANRVEYFLKNETTLIDTIYDEKVHYIFAIDDASLLLKIAEYTKGIEPIYIAQEIVEKVL